jgi:hypothetical protein
MTLAQRVRNYYALSQDLHVHMQALSYSIAHDVYNHIKYSTPSVSTIV